MSITSSVGDTFMKLFLSPYIPSFKAHRKIIPLSPLTLSSLGRETGLRVTHPITSEYHFQGYCMGAALVMSVCYLIRNGELNQRLLKRDYKTSLANVILLQKLQEQFLGLQGKCSEDRIRFFAKFLIHWHNKGLLIPLPDEFQSQPLQEIYGSVIAFIQGAREISLKKHVIDNLEARDISFSSDDYRLILEICGFHEKLKNQKIYRFHRLQSDVLQELSSLCHMRATEIFAGFGTKETISENLEEAQPGIYHISYASHSFLFIREPNGNRWFWDVRTGFKKIEKTTRKQLENFILNRYRSQTNWIIISQLLLNRE